MIVYWLLMSVVQGLLTGNRVVDYVITESGVERFGLLTIIVLGEVVTGVVNGMLETDRSLIVAITVVFALFIGFGFWWNYFDAVGRRLPKRDPVAYGIWSFTHIPLTGSIAAAGAGMVSLVEHAHSPRTPGPTAWLLAGSSAVMLALVAVLVMNVDYGRAARAATRRHLVIALTMGALASLLVGWWAPAPWLFALALAGVHSTIWIVAFISIARARIANGLGRAQF